jgi:two-component system OmpR family response regulator
MGARILVVDDSVDYQEMVKKTFDRTQTIVPAYNLAEAEKALDVSDFDLILLDVHLPDGDGFSFYAKLRTMPHTMDTPVIFVTTNDSAAGEVMGFSLGAEDYVVKPVDPVRLRSRVEARLRSLEDKQEKELTLHKGDLRVSVSLQKVAIVKDGRETQITLTPVEFKLLFHFLRHEGFVFSRVQLLNAVWGNASDVFERTVDMHISKLRRKINESSYRIQAVHGSGYRLSKEASPAAASH